MLFILWFGEWETENERKSGGGSRLENENDTIRWDIEVVDFLERIFEYIQ